MPRPLPVTRDKQAACAVSKAKVQTVISKTDMTTKEDVALMNCIDEMKRLKLTSPALLGGSFAAALDCTTPILLLVKTCLPLHRLSTP